MWVPDPLSQAFTFCCCNIRNPGLTARLTQPVALAATGSRRQSGRSSGVEHNLAKVGVEGSNPFARSSDFQAIGSPCTTVAATVQYYYRPDRPSDQSADCLSLVVWNSSGRWAGTGRLPDRLGHVRNPALPLYAAGAVTAARRVARGPSVRQAASASAMPVMVWRSLRTMGDTMPRWATKRSTTWRRLPPASAQIVA